MNVHFSELLLIFLVALIVIKPDRLPEVAYHLGKWFKWLQKMTAKIKNAVDQPMSKYSFHESPKETVDHE